MSATQKDLENMTVLDLGKEIKRLSDEIDQDKKSRAEYIKKLDDFWAKCDAEAKRLAALRKEKV